MRSRLTFSDWLGITLVFLFGQSASGTDLVPNDHFSDREILEGSSVAVAGTFAGATVDVVEKPLVQHSASVWYEWTASRSGPVLLRPKGGMEGRIIVSRSDSLVGALSTPPVDAISLVSLIKLSYLFFEAEAGQIFQIGVFGEPALPEFGFELVMTNHPVILQHPKAYRAFPESAFVFTVVTARLPGAPANHFQWRFNGVDLPNETRPMLALNGLTEADAGEYSVVVTAPQTGLAKTSLGARLKVSAPAAPPVAAIRRGAGGVVFAVEAEPARPLWFRTSGDALFSHGLGGTLGVVLAHFFPYERPPHKAMFFWRVAYYVPPNPTCYMNLNQLQTAKALWALDNRRGGWDEPDEAAFKAYLGTDALRCPDGGVYYPQIMIDPVYCTQPGHYPVEFQLNIFP